MKVRYIGPYADDGVELHDGTWFDGHVDTEVPAELAASLLEQTGTWEPADDEALALVPAVVVQDADLLGTPPADDPPADDPPDSQPTGDPAAGDPDPTDPEVVQ
jgi:hypothetical protein